MRRSKPATVLFDPEIYKLMEKAESNISTYLYELACTDLIRRGLLSMEKWNEIRGIEPLPTHR